MSLPPRAPSRVPMPLGVIAVLAGILCFLALTLEVKWAIWAARSGPARRVIK